MRIRANNLIALNANSYHNTIKLVIIIIQIARITLCYQPQAYFQIQQIGFSQAQPCQQKPDSQSSTLKFSQLFPGQNNTQRMAFAIFTAFFGYYAYDYTLFSIHQSDLVVSLDYNLSQNKIFLKINGIPNETQDSMICINQWIGIGLDISISSNTIQAQLLIQQLNTNNVFVQIPFLQTFIGKFKTNELEINYGNPPKRLGVFPSCQLVSFLSIGISDIINSAQINQIFYQIILKKTEILYNYDFFYTQSNLEQVLSNKGDLFLKQNVMEQFNNTISFNNNSIQTNYIDINNEMILSFYIKLNQMPLFNSPYLCIQFDSNSLCLYFEEGKIQLLSTIFNQNNLVWNHIVIVRQEKIYLFSNGVKKVAETWITDQVFRVRLEFFSVDSPYQLNHIRIYKGSYVNTNQKCYFQVSDGSCVICMNGYLLDFSNNMQCVQKSTSNSDSEILGVKDWNPPRIICPKNMINDQSSPNGCKCLLGYYLEDKDCIKCPEYCRYCSSLQDCHKQRDSKGNCSDKNAFDDGQDCLMPLFVIPYRQNTRRILQKPEFGPACVSSDVDPDLNKFIFTKDQLNLQAGDSIFFSFSLIAKTVNLQFSGLIIATIKNNNNIIMKITLSCSIINSVFILFIKYFVNDQLQQQYIFDQNELAWIAFWTDNSNYLFLFRTNQHNYYNQQTGSFQFITSSNIELCVGRCDTILTGCLSLISFPITFIKNIPYPSQSEGINQFFTIYQEDFPQIGRYKLDVNQMQPITYIADNDQPGQPYLQFDNPLQILNEFQGFQLNENIHATIIYTTSYEDLFTISFNIEFDPAFQYSQFKVLEITNEATNLKVFILPDYDQEIMVVQIQYQSVTKTFKKAVLHFNQSNFFLIATRVENKKLRQVSITTLFMDITCNQAQETFQIIVSPGTKIKQIDFGDYIPHKVYLDNINIYPLNTFVYYDLTNYDPCFVYINLENMKCIQLKKGYLYYKNQIVTYQECYQISRNLKLLAFINQKEQTCNQKPPTNLQEQLCAAMQYMTESFKCTECKDPNSDPNSSCLVCKQSYFFNILSNKCEMCDTQCKSCSGNSNNCVECEYINQIIPSCDCIQSNLPTKNICTCNQKCKTCSPVDNNFCLSCNGENRMLPSCECMPNFIEIQNKCVEIKIMCLEKCQNCQTTQENCTVCSQNRVNPPLCHCPFGYQEQSDGNCIACWKGTQYDPTTKSCKPCTYDSQQFKESSCLKGLSVELSNIYQNKKYYIIFSFEQTLKNFNISEIELSQVIKFYIPEIPNNYYDLKNPKYIKNQFQVELGVKASFQADYIYVIIISNKYFVSEDQEYILHPKHLNVQMKAKIGPFILQEIEIKVTENLSNSLNQFKSANTDVFSIINQLQIVFYVLNTLQPVSVFLLLNAIFPPQLYQFYQIVGTFVFPQVPDYLNENNNKQMSLFGYKLQEKDVKQPDFGKFKSLGFSQSVIVNIPILLIQQFSLLFLIILIIFNEYFKFYKNQHLQKIKTFLIQKFNGDQETTLAVTFICIFVQFVEINEESYIYRMGLYLSIVLICIHVSILKFNIQNVNSRCRQKREYSNMYTERIDFSQNWLSKYYFQIQTVKKYLYLAVVCIFFKYPIVICSICGVIFLISAVHTILAKAYKSKVSRAIKFIGEMVFSSVWFLHIPLINLEQKFKQDKILNNKQFQQYIFLGNVILLLLLSFNLLFLVQFCLNFAKLIIGLIHKSQTPQKKQKQIDKNKN